VRAYTHFRSTVAAVLIVLSGLFCLSAYQIEAQSVDPAPERRLLLVLPYENQTGQPNLDWIGEAVPEILNQRLASAGFLPIGRIDRQYALSHLGLPIHFQPSRATAIRIAETLDANYVVLGSYSLQNQRFTTTTRILNVDSLTLGEPLQEQGDLTHLLEDLNSTAWRVARALDPHYSVSESTFVAASANLRVDGFEDYVRGLLDSSSAERIRHLSDATQINPHYSPGWLALGQAYFTDQQYELAANALGHLPKSDPNALLAEFYRGLAFFYTGNYASAEDAFGFIAGQLPIAEVLNNEGVARARRGVDGSSFFREAIANDPADPDYEFNLAVSLKRKSDRAGAVAAINQALKLRPEDSEAAGFASHIQNPPQPVASTFTATPRPSAEAARDPESAADGPLERIKRNFNDASFRQAAFAMEQMQSMRLDAMPPAAHAAALTSEGVQYLANGLILEAERQFQAALALDSSNANAHAGLGEVRERDGDNDAARREAQASVKLKPNALAYIVLAQLDLAAKQLPAAASEVQQAIALDPSDTVARTLQQTIQARQQRAQ